MMMYKVVIGLEIHCELNTKSKVFSPSENVYSTFHNSNLSVVDLGFPGVLPTLNKEALIKALTVSKALNCSIPDVILFDRKNYFYPDLPKGYQITQSHKPFGVDGYLMVNLDDYDKKVLIHDIHLEEDTASIDHYSNYSLLDYNRAGMPLIEIVTEPVLNSSKEVLAFLDALRRVIIYLDLSEARVDKGQIRCDVNISLMRENDSKLGTKVEIKNINSFYNVKDAIDYEIKRQSEILDNNGVIIQETRRYDDNTKSTISMRSKVDAIDYKYFVEPNIPCMKISCEILEEVERRMVRLPFDRYKYYVDNLGLNKLDATTLVKDRQISDYFEECLQYDVSPKSIANVLNSTVLGYLNKNNLSILDVSLTPNMLISLIKMVEEGKITSKQGKEVLLKSLDSGKDPVTLVSELNITQINSDEEIRGIVRNVIVNNSNMVEKYKSGRNVLDFFIGNVMKETKGRANPKLTSDIVKDELDKLC